MDRNSPSITNIFYFSKSCILSKINFHIYVVVEIILYSYHKYFISYTWILVFAVV